MAIRAVIFDLFDVLVREGDLQERRRWERSAGVAEGGLQRALFRSAQFRAAIAGWATEAELWRDVAQTLGVDAGAWRALETAFYSSWRPNRELVDLVRALRPHYKTAILSNAPLDVRGLVLERFHWDQEVDVALISSEVGLMKPAAALYRLATGRLGVAPQEALFVDDDAALVAGAAAAGLQALRFVETAQATAEIRRRLRGSERTVERARGIGLRR
jgi:HAD superfamily hydrolase (TIGR01509 family)